MAGTPEQRKTQPQTLCNAEFQSPPNTTTQGQQHPHQIWTRVASHTIAATAEKKKEEKKHSNFEEPRKTSNTTLKRHHGSKLPNHHHVFLKVICTLFSVNQAEHPKANLKCTAARIPPSCALDLNHSLLHLPHEPNKGGPQIWSRHN